MDDRSWNAKILGKRHQARCEGPRCVPAVDAHTAARFTDALSLSCVGGSPQRPAFSSDNCFILRDEYLNAYRFLSIEQMISGVAPEKSGVSISPGTIVFTRIPMLAWSRASSVMAMMLPLLALYAA